MTTTFNSRLAKNEIVIFMRNQDIFTITQRGVTTDNDTGTFSADTEYVINKTNVKNIRAITVDATPLVFGTDYLVDYNFLDTTIKCKITFTSAQTGAYDIEYDYGTDKIYPDLPRTDLSIDSFPRIAIDTIGLDTEELGLGADANMTNASFAIYVYDSKTSTIESFIDTLRTKFIQNKKNFFYMNFLTVVTVGPMLLYGSGKQKIYQKNLDLISLFNVEEV